MERRLRARGIPGKETVAFLSGTRTPSVIMDYNVNGMLVQIDGSESKMAPGKHLDVDIMVNGNLCACGLSGKVSWCSKGRAGIQLEHRNECQLKGAHNVELFIVNG